MQAGNGYRDGLTAFHSIILLTTDYTTLDFSPSNEYRLQSSCMKFVLTPGAAITPVKITLASADGSKCFYTTNEETNDASILSLGVKNITLKGTTGDEGTITAYMMMSVNEVILPAAGIIVTVDAEDGSRYTQTISFDNKTTLASGMMHTITATQMKPVSTTYTNTTEASTFLYTADGTDTKAGTATNPYLISSAEDLKLVQNLTNNTATNTYKDKCYKLTTDITIATNPTSWTPIGNSTTGSKFKGTFDGDGHSVKGLYINTDQTYQGFFGYINEGKVMNLNVTGEIISTYSHSDSNGIVGGISGQLYGNSYIIGCSYSGSITGTGSATKIGGICGEVYDSYVIGCYNTSAVTSNTQQSGLHCGGIAGYTGSSNVRIIGCYNTGAVTGTSKTKVGGVVATNQGKVMGCYNTGSVTGTNEDGASCGGILGTNSTITTTTTGCLWVKSSAAGTATVGIGKDNDAGTINPLDDIATLNSNANIAILNAAIDTWNSDTSDTKGPKGDTTSPKYCHFQFGAGTDNATPPILTAIP